VVCNIKEDDNKISTDIFSKPTDSHNYLDFYSSHAKHTKENIPFNLASRLITIVSDECVLGRRLQELVCYLKCQHYPEEIILSGIKKTKEKGPLSSRLQNLEQNSNDTIPFVSTYNPCNFNIFPVIKSYECYMKSNECMK